MPTMFDFRSHLERQRQFSERTFGPGARTAGVVDHIRKELREIEADPADISEWIDVVILALDGAWRAGHTPDGIITALVAKQDKNERRAWPDWRTLPQDVAIEHVRTASEVAMAADAGPDEKCDPDCDCSYCQRVRARADHARTGELESQFSALASALSGQESQS